VELGEEGVGPPGGSFSILFPAGRSELLDSCFEETGVGKTTAGNVAELWGAESVGSDSDSLPSISVSFWVV